MASYERFGLEARDETMDEEGRADKIDVRDGECIAKHRYRKM